MSTGADARLVAVRCDAAQAIGWGHLKRCLALGQALAEQGLQPLFLLGASDIDAAALVAAAGLRAQTLAVPAAWRPDMDADAAATLAALAGRRPALVLVDHYGLDARWHRQVAAATGARLAAVDDLGDRAMAVDLLIDHNPSPSHADKYRAVLPAGARLCGGPSFALLDPVYRGAAPRPWDDTVRRVGLFMGGTDPGHHSLLAWRALREVAGWAGPVDLALTRGHRHLAQWQALAHQDPALRLWLDQPHLADFHRSHDLQIGAGGGALWERCALGVPTLAVVCAENQRLSVPLLQQQGVVAAFDAAPSWDDTHVLALGALAAALLADAPRRRRLRERGLTLVDGRGATRCAAELLALARSPAPAAGLAA